MAVDLQHRHEPVRIDRAIAGIVLGPLAKVDRAAFIVDALQFEGDADAVGG